MIIKNVCAHLSRINVLSGRKKCAYTTMETHLPNKFIYAHQKSHVTLRQETRIDLTSSGPMKFTASISCYGHSQKPQESLSSKYFCIIVWHDSVLKQLVSSSERTTFSHKRCHTVIQLTTKDYRYTWKELYVHRLWLWCFEAPYWQNCVTATWSKIR